MIIPAAVRSIFEAVQHTSLYRNVTEEDQSAPEMSITKLVSHA